ncbi:MAG: hypothetical protein ABI972_11035 [Acidobacteriota bacterium]
MLCRLILCFTLAGLAHSQSPAVRPEPRKRIAADPERILQTFLKNSDEVRLIAANLDDDPELERVIVQKDHSGERAMVFDFDGKSWWQVGEFSNLDGNDPIELKGATSSSPNDLFVRVYGHGSGFYSTELSIYKMLAGRLYRVFRTMEANNFDTAGPGTKGEWHVERRNVIAPVKDETRGSVLIVHRTDAIDPDNDAPCRPRSVACSVYRWDREEFRFLRDLEADAAHCDVKTRQPLARNVTACAQ